MRKDPTTTTISDKTTQTNRRNKLTNDAIGFDFCLIAKMDGRKVKSIFPAGTPLKELNSFFRLTGSLAYLKN